MRAIALHSIIPVRSEPREASEQLTQMLFAETCTVLAQEARWMRIRLDNDGQEGWVDRKMLTPMSSSEYRRHHEALRTAARVAMPVAYAVSENNGQTLPLTAGTCLPDYSEGSFAVLGVRFRIDPSMVLAAPLPLSAENLLRVLRFFLNIPYLWGGKNALGLDCSGLTQVVMSLFGRQLRRNAGEQVQQGRAVASLGHAKAGDLAFFDHHDGRISHVGILLDSERVVHCSGRVKVEKIDEIGIVGADPASLFEPDGVHTHYLAAIRRYRNS